MREAHTHIVLAGIARNTRTILVTSPRPSEARSSFSVDLAQLFTRSGYRVLLVDADTERATLTEMIGNGSEGRRPVVVYNGETEIWSSLQATPIKNVMLLAHNTGPDGRPLPPSLPWPALLENLNRAADVLIFDGPSSMSGVDAALLAPLVDGVVLTLNPATDHSRDIQQSTLRLTRQRDTSLLGAVMLTDEQPVAAPQPGRRRLPAALFQRLLGGSAPRMIEAAKLDVAANAATRVIITPASDAIAPAEAPTQDVVELVDGQVEQRDPDERAGEEAGVTADMIFGPVERGVGETPPPAQDGAGRASTAPEPA
jgi:MinD-like ATPase involved in chromosome partitioning or flagellar assembly